jgi:hypothetical protein
LIYLLLCRRSEHKRTPAQQGKITTPQRSWHCAFSLMATCTF